MTRTVRPKRRGDAFELRVKRALERTYGHAKVFAGSPSEPGADLLLLCCGQIVEAKKRPWSKLPSPKRRQACAMGDYYRRRGIPHQIAVGDGKGGIRWLVGGMFAPNPDDKERASILYEGILPSFAECRGMTGTGLVPVTVPGAEREEE